MEKTTTYVRELETQIRFLRKQIGEWAKTVREQVAMNMADSRIDHGPINRVLDQMEAVAGKEEWGK